ncbi:MAG TPA: alpha/beta hydrolase [Solirubrobacteraceae bacterium]|jgi:pimeloyl-ACP methyl ester carboxylesterase|nr:alpha/beta hydrolase [Solirubrobacteraceae bacterium]
MPLLDLPTGQLAYDERGEGEAKLVLLASGAHERRDYDELRALIPPRFRTIAVDWPAHGESPAGSLTGSAMHLADVAEQAVARLAPEGAVVLGNSVGGFAAARLAIRRPELVRGLVIVDGGGFAGRPPHERAFCWLMSHPGFLRAIYPAFSALYMRARADADRRARRAAIATTRTEAGARAVGELWRSFASPEHDLRAEASAISAPTLVVWGRRDPVISPRVGRRVAATIPGARLVVIDSGHLPHTSDPEGVAAALSAFAEEVAA